MSKNPFEIRQDLLHLAYNLLKEKKQSQYTIKNENNRIKEMKLHRGEAAEEPEMFQESDLVINESELFSLADKLKEFVSKKD